MKRDTQPGAYITGKHSTRPTATIKEKENTHRTHTHAQPQRSSDRQPCSTQQVLPEKDRGGLDENENSRRILVRGMGVVWMQSMGM